ncbi:MAG TPA: hypothetical protein VGQ17_02275 [Gemmatimonadales bacterium]|jgi:hypothetical protein|nr:hypothetical protein [Gemmatimonadales bacterium]
MRSPAPAPRPVHHDERGIALAIALLAIIVIGALITGTFFSGRTEMQSGRNALYLGQATEAAETGLADAFASWNSTWNKFGVGGDSIRTTVMPLAGSGDNSVRYTQIVRRMGAGLYLVTARGEKLDQGGNIMATRLLARLGKLVPPWIDITSAVTSKGNVVVSGNSDIDGQNVAPNGWGGCPVGGADLAGIRTSGTVTTNGTPTISGDPATVQNDATVVDSLFQKPYYQLLPYATITITGSPDWNNVGPSTTGSPARCNTGDVRNWGEPGRTGFGTTGSAPLTPVCQDYYPVIYANGGLKLQTGRGQGVLLVAGDLDIRGNFEFDGVIIALGEVKTDGTGNKITGAILANNTVIGDLTTFSGNPTVLYSQCAVSAVLQGTAKGFPLTERSWAQVNTR